MNKLFCAFKVIIDREGPLLFSFLYALQLFCSLPPPSKHIHVPKEVYIKMTEEVRL
jgi:hypothetical protein